MPDAPVHDAARPLIEAFVWLVVPLAFFLSLIWGGAVFVAIVKGRGLELRERVLHARKAGEPWLHYWLSIPGAIGNLTILAIASVDWVNGGRLLRQSVPPPTHRDTPCLGPSNSRGEWIGEVHEARQRWVWP